MKYLRCTCGVHTFISEIQKNCNSCGRYIQVEEVQKNLETQRKSGVDYLPVMRITPAHVRQFDMNKWNEGQKKKENRIIGYAS
jgi:hypothetical protein